jgi:hypothetical protein
MQRDLQLKLYDVGAKKEGDGVCPGSSARSR